MTGKLLRISDVMECTALSRSYIYRLIQRGEFPKPVQLGEKCSRWFEPEISEWIESLKADRKGR